jgi:hypothetical protein
MTVPEARQILGVRPDEDWRVHFRGFCVVRGDLVEGLAVPLPEVPAAGGLASSRLPAAN